MATEKILLLIENKENRRLIDDWLTECEGEGMCYEVQAGNSDEALEEDYDLGIIDGPALHRLAEQIRARKERKTRIFLPFVLITPRQDVSLAKRQLWQTVDEAIIVPTDRIELQARLEVLLRARRYSLELAQDLEQRERAEEALRESEVRFRALVTATSDVVYRMSPDWTEMRQLNSRGFLVETATPIHNWLEKYISPGDRPSVLAAINEAIRTKSIFQLEHRVIRADGSIGWTFSRAIPLLNENDEIVEWMGIASDVTERKRAEDARRRSETILKQAGQMAQLGAWDIEISNQKDLNANRLRWSEETYRIFGYEPGEIEVSNDLFFQHVYPEDRDRVGDAVAEAIARKQPYSVEHRIIRKDGAMRVVLERAEITFDDRGRPVHIIGAIQDITELTQVEEERERLLQEVQRRVAELAAVNRELEAFSYSVSHDLRAPLRQIDGFSKLLLEKFSDRLDDRGRQYLQFLRNGTHRMDELIDAMLKLSRVTRAELRRQPVALSEMAESILSELHKDQPERQIEFDIVPDVIADGDPQLLRIVMENLLGNAWKFTSKRQIAKIEFGVTRQDNKTVYYVRDNGAGFDPRYADRLFTPFQRLHKAEEFPGTGIGLATVQRIIRRHGGNIWAEGEVDKGAMFYFTLS